MDLIAQQRLGRAGWGREVEKMIRWGAAVPDAEKPRLIEELSLRYGPGPTPAGAGRAAEGAAIFRSRCLACHGSDLSDQQRLGRPGWEREVDKMVRWGADVSPEDKQALVDYLVARAGP